MEENKTQVEKVQEEKISKIRSRLKGLADIVRKAKHHVTDEEKIPQKQNTKV